ncbi:MAG: ThuA domain-containing protein [Gemmataceae bacterium]|nr:ThuA domain-containing protein [Gemmataceae bacterium]
MWRALTLALVVVVGVSPALAAEKNLLVITESKGFVHSVVKRPKAEELCLVEKTLILLGEKSGAFKATVTQNSREAITAENLKKYDAVFFYTTGELPLSDTQKADLLQFIRSGKGFAGSHCATDTFYKWPEYGKLIGGYFDGHPWHEKIQVIVEDTKHPATAHLGDKFQITDEIYQFKGPYDRGDLHILMRMDAEFTKKPGKRQDKDYALAWTREYGKGRVFYTALGHREDVWADERFQKHMLGGLKYVMNLADGEATPSKKPGK